MVETFKKLILRLLPEINSGYHLPRFAKVVTISDAPTAGAISDEFRPHYAVDIQVLTADGLPDSELPVFQSVPLPAQSVGQEQGSYGFPSEGTVVVVGFAYGLNHKPFIQQVMPRNVSLPELDQGDLLTQHSHDSYQRADRNGDWQRKATTKIHDQAIERLVEAVENLEQYQNSQIDVAEHSTETIGGTKIIEALGRLALLSGGHLNIGAADNLNLTTGADINLTAGRNILEAINGIKKSVAKLNQHIAVEDGGTIWLGDDSVNVLALLNQLCGVVESLASTTSSHTHPNVSTPTQAAAFTGHASDASGIQTTLTPMLEA